MPWLHDHIRLKCGQREAKMVAAKMGPQRYQMVHTLQILLGHAKHTAVWCHLWERTWTGGCMHAWVLLSMNPFREWGMVYGSGIAAWGRGMVGYVCLLPTWLAVM